MVSVAKSKLLFTVEVIKPEASVTTVVTLIVPSFSFPPTPISKTASFGSLFSVLRRETDSA